MLTKQAARFFAETDNKPPPRVKRMVVRRRMRSRRGPLTLLLETSCGMRDVRRGAHIAAEVSGVGAMKLTLLDAREDEPVAVKRCQVSDWREAAGEFERAKKLIGV